MNRSNDNNEAVGKRRKRAEEKLKSALSITKEAKKVTTRKRPTSDISITGSNNIVGDGNSVNVYNSPPVERKVVVVKTGDGVITAQQKGELKRLVSEIVDTENQLKKSPRSYGAVWGSLLKYVGKTLMGGCPINKYDETPQIHYEGAHRYLSMELGKLRSMRSAPKKVDNWRAKCLAAIWAEAKKYPNGEAAVRAYAEGRFGTPSTSDLDDKQLAAVKTHVQGWKRRATK